MIQLRDVIAVLPPERFDMSSWHCGTVACIGGTAEILFFGSIGADRSTESVGAVLGLNGDQAYELFHPDVERSWSEITTAEAVRVINHYLATGEIDWSAALSGQA